MTKGSKATAKLKDLATAIKRNNPYSIKKVEDGYKLKKSETSFNPTKDKFSDRVYVIKLDGQDSEVYEAKKFGDDLVLEYNDVECAITSKPILIEGNQFYFTKDGFIGTMALNKDTLLSGDVYQPSLERKTRKISKDVDFNKLGIDIENSKKVVNETENYYELENSNIGDVASLQGSKRTVKEMNKAKRLRKLLKPSGLDKKTLIMAIGTGVAIGMYLYPTVMGA